MEFSDEIYRRIWSDIKDGECFPTVRPILAHYTSVPALEGIIRNEEIWLSHPLLMNDHQEMSFGLLEGHRQFMAHKGLVNACGTSERHQELATAFGYHFDEYITKHSHDVYVGCFCEHDQGDDDGLLSMWRAYGANGGGVAIVFDTSKLDAKEDSPLQLHPVTYLSDTQRKEWISAKLDDCAQWIRDLRPLDNELGFAAFHIFQRLKQFALFTKHRGFREEKEWRLVYSPDLDDQGRYQSMLSYIINDRGIHPKLKLSFKHGEHFAPLGVDGLVDTVLLGPTSGARLSQVAVKRMLASLQHPALALRVRSCTTPFRPL